SLVPACDLVKDFVIKSSRNRKVVRRPGGLNRREFITRTAVGVAAFNIVPRHVLGGAKFVAPSEKVNLAIVGCGGQGQTNVRNLFQQPDVQIIAVADPIEVQNLEGFYYKSTSGRLPLKAEIEKH